MNIEDFLKNSILIFALTMDSFMVSFSYGASRIKISFSVVAGMNLVMSGMLGMAVWIFLFYRRQDNRCSGRSFTWWNGGISDLSLCSDTKAEYDEKNKKIKFYEWDYSGSGTVY